MRLRFAATLKTKSQSVLTYVLLGAGAALLLYACLLQAWISMRVPLWGDELDMMLTTFRNWRGHQSFWWQLGQFNAQPPGDNLLLRLYYRSGALAWLRESSPEFFWRLQYIMVFAASALVSALGTWHWTRSRFAAFVIFALTLMSPGMLEYGNNVRFYIWSAFFSAALLWTFFLMVEQPRSWLYYLFSVLATLGVCFHLTAVPAAYLFMGYALAWLAYDVYRKPLAIFSHLRGLPRLFFGALPFIIYKVEAKHVLFIPHPWKEADPWGMFKSLGLDAAIIGPMQSNLPLHLSFQTLYLLIGAVTLATIYYLAKRDLAAALQGAYLGLYLVATPVALFYSAAQRNYGLSGRHFVFAIPVALGAAIYLLKPLVRIRVPVVGALAGIVLCALVTHEAFSQISTFVSSRGETTPARVTYPFITWRNAYSAMPDSKPLVIVGTQPDRYGPMSDQGEFRAGIMYFYTNDFKPVFLSEKGSYNQSSELDASVARKIEKTPSAYDYLVLDGLEYAKRRFPKLPWKSFKCMTYKPGAALSFCRT